MLSAPAFTHHLYPTAILLKKKENLANSHKICVNDVVGTNLILFGDTALGTDEDPDHTSMTITSGGVERGIAILRHKILLIKIPIIKNQIDSTYILD